MPPTYSNKNHIHVTCAIIEENGRVLAAQRGRETSLPLKWEFPGGKIRSGESPEDCLRRELVEELGVEVEVCRSLAPATHEYTELVVTLYPFVCSIASGRLTLHEHESVSWQSPEELFLLDWAEADLPVLADYCRQLFEK